MQAREAEAFLSDAGYQRVVLDQGVAGPSLAWTSLA